MTEDSAELPGRGRILGIDYGTKRVGVAVSDLFQQMASPLDNYQRNGVQADTRYFRKVVIEYEIRGIVVGLPLHVSGDESAKSRESREYGRWLHNITGCPVTWHDERYTSTHAEGMLLQAELTKKQRKQKLDKLAASLILQSWLNTRTPEPRPGLRHDPVEDFDGADFEGEQTAGDDEISDDE